MRLQPLTRFTTWPSKDPTRNAAFLWRTDIDTLASQVQIGPSSSFPDGAQIIDGYTFRFGGGLPNEGPFRMHEVKVCGSLEPGTAYSYRVGGAGAWSEVYNFDTPAASIDTLRVGMVGD